MSVEYTWNEYYTFGLVLVPADKAANVWLKYGIGYSNIFFQYFRELLLNTIVKYNKYYNEFMMKCFMSSNFW